MDVLIPKKLDGQIPGLWIRSVLDNFYQEAPGECIRILFEFFELIIDAVRHPRRWTVSATRRHPKREEDAQDAPLTSPPAHHVSCPVPMMILHKSSLSQS
jgi:hypothetical protein